MNYIKQLNTFYELLQINSVNANSQCLYSHLMNINNKCNWKKEFTVANTLLMALTGLSISTLQRARNDLIQKGYIKYKKNNGNQAGIYTIIEFEQQYEQQIEYQYEQQYEQQTDSNVNTLDKLNKTKLKKRNIKKNYGENKNVKFTDEEYEKVKAYFPTDYIERIQILDDYIQSTGKKYKDFFATLKNWARKDGYKPPVIEKSKEFKEIDTSNLTDEEYAKLLKGR